MVILAAGCGRSPNSVESTTSPSAVGYSACIRAHGVPNFPDPGSDGQVPKGDARAFGVSTDRLQAAQAACQDRYPDDASFEQQTEQCMSTTVCPQALVQRILAAERRFSVCMRSHGEPDWPDPSLDAHGRPVFVMSNVGPHNRDYWRTPPMAAKIDACQREAPSPLPFG